MGVADHYLGGSKGQGTDWIERRVAPQLFPNCAANVVEHRGDEAGPLERLAQLPGPLRGGAVGFAEQEAVAGGMSNDAGLANLERCIGDAADNSLRADATPQDAAWIDTFYPPALPRGRVFVEVPPGNAVLCRDHSGVVLEQGRHLFGDGRQGLGLEGHDDEVLGAEFGRVVGAHRARRPGFAINVEAQPVGTHRRQVWAAGNQGHLGARKRQLNPQVTTDGPGTIDTDFQRLALIVVNDSVYSGFALNRSFGARRGDFCVIVTNHRLQDFFGMLTQERRSVDLGRRVR